MTISRADTLDKIRKRLCTFFQQRRDIAWARFRADGPDEKSSIVKVTVMPSEPWWSRLEREHLAREVLALLGRHVVLEDERAVHPRRFEELIEKWELLIDRDLVRRVDMERDRSHTWFMISEFQQSSEASQALGVLADILQSSAIREERKKRFRRIREFAISEDLFGPDAFGENDWGQISNAAQEAGREMLAMCCDVISLYREGAPRNTTDAVGFLADKGFLDSDCAVRVANWLSLALHREFLFQNDLTRVRLLLEIRWKDLDEFCDAVSRAGASQKATKNNFLPSELLVFDLQAALAGLSDLAEQTKDKAELGLISRIKSDVLKRQSEGTSVEDLMSNPEGVFAQPPVTSILVLQASAFDRLFPRRIAHALYGDPSLVYDIGEALDADAPHRRCDSVWGRSKAFAPTGIESLPEFVQSHGRAVVFFQDADQADPTHLSRLAVMADAQLRCPNGQRLFVGNTCLIVCGRFSIGTPREIDFHGSHGGEPPSEFCRLIEHDAVLRSPEHLSASIRSRFYISVDCIWARYLQLVASSSLDEPLAARSPITEAERTLPSKQALHQIEDLSQLIRVTPEPDKFDFFVSYSWTRTESQAHKLAYILKSRGHNVFLDKDRIVKRDISMEELVPELICAVRSSKALLLFPIQLKEPITDLVADEDIEVQHGRAMWAPALGGGGTVLSEWSWQTLELLAATHYLVVEEHRVYAVAHDRLDPDFIARRYQSVEELADVCKSYLDLRHQQGI